MLISLTFLSFGSYVLLEDFEVKTENVSHDTSEENSNSAEETSKELTDSYLYEQTFHFSLLAVFSSKQFPSLEMNVSSFSVKPSIPPPDLFEN